MLKRFLAILVALAVLLSSIPAFAITPVTIVDGNENTIVSSSGIKTTQADGADTTLGAKADNRSTATDTTAVTAMSIWKQISYMLQNPAAITATVTGVSTESTLAKLAIAQATDLGSNTVTMVGASVTTSNPSYTTGKIYPLSMGTDGTLRTRTDLNAGTSIISGQKAVTTAGTEVALASTTAILSVTLKAKVGNTGYIYTGPNGVSSTTGFVLSKGESITYDTDDLADVYIDSSVNGEGVSYTALVK
ncbi:MAG: hypothetical protein WC738_04355 [Candidatus Omnitrophota bacterium]|jgi:hypothetical protein